MEEERETGSLQEIEGDERIDEAGNTATRKEVEHEGKKGAEDKKSEHQTDSNFKWELIARVIDRMEENSQKVGQKPTYEYRGEIQEEKR